MAHDANFSRSVRALSTAQNKMVLGNTLELRNILKKAIARTLKENVPAQVSLDDAQKEAEATLTH
jgi:ABC-type iron transport system FetAB permease component